MVSTSPSIGPFRAHSFAIDDDPTAFVTPVTVLGENDLADEEDPEVHAARWRFGSPMDIRWFNARHDGYPFSPTLSSYSQIRRHGALPSVRDDAALWVSAMTLGVLEAVMHARIPESLLLIPGAHEGERVLSGTRMLRLMVNWHHHMHSHYPNWQHQSTYHADDATRLAHGQDAARILHRALNALDEEIWNAASILRRAGRDHEVTEMVCALTLLLAPLCGIAWCCWKTIPEMNTLVAAVSGAERRFVNVAIGGCAKVMHRAGWCPNTISEPFLFSFVDLSIISNLLRLPPYVRNNPGEHADCMQSACVYYTITDTKAYVPRHVEPNCQCDYIKPPLDVVLNILSEGHIPVVVYDGAELLAHSAQKRPYVAISHVWADGMGSTTEDGLPTCVVKRVASLAQNLVPESGAFWMDSLCVPAITQARKRAILLMAQTYRDAAKVLVIDACIRAQCSTSLSLQENVVRLSLSGWVRRVWTLQEGLLARELYFEFVEGPVNVAEAWSLGPSLPKDFQLHQLCRAMVPILSFRAVHGKHIDIERKAPLADIVRMLRLRSTTKPEDEIVAISSLLPLNLDAILAITGEDMAQRRMREFFLQLREVSSEFPMYPNAPRLTLPGFTWAPRTLARELAAANNMSGTGVCTEDGLLAEYFVTSLEEPIPIPTGETLGTATSGDLEFFVALRSSRSVYCLRLFITSGHAHSASIDTLLMLDGKMSDSNFTKCAGVRRGGRKEVEVEENESSTHHFSYVTPGFLDPRPGNPELFLDGKLVWVGEPHKMDVRLT